MGLGNMPIDAAQVQYEGMPIDPGAVQYEGMPIDPAEVVISDQGPGIDDQLSGVRGQGPAIDDQGPGIVGQDVSGVPVESGAVGFDQGLSPGGQGPMIQSPEPAPGPYEGYRPFEVDPALDPEPTATEQQYIDAGLEPPRREYIKQGVGVREQGPGVSLRGMGRSVQGFGAVAAEALNLGSASFAGDLARTSDYIEAKTGIQFRNDSERAVKEYMDNAEYWHKIAQEKGTSFASRTLGRAIGGFAPGIASFMLNIPFAALHGAALAYEAGDSEAYGAIVKGFERWVMGRVLHVLGVFERPYAAAGMGGVFATQTAMEEDATTEQILESLVTGGLYSLTMPAGKQSPKTIIRDTVIRAQLKHAAGLDKEFKKVAADRLLGEEFKAGVGDQGSGAKSRGQGSGIRDQAGRPEIDPEGVEVGKVAAKDSADVNELTQLEQKMLNDKRNYEDMSETEQGAYVRAKLKTKIKGKTDQYSKELMARGIDVGSFLENPIDT